MKRATPNLLQDVQPLTKREQSVAYLVAAGYANKEIADMLGISDVTVKFHVGQLLTKTNTPSRVAAIVVLHQHGALDLSAINVRRVTRGPHDRNKCGAPYRSEAA